MPEQGRYEKLPRPESIRALVTYLQSSSAVRLRLPGSRREIRVLG